MSADAWGDVATCSGCGRAAQTDPCAYCEVDYGDDVLGPAPSKAAGEPIDGSASVFEALDGAATEDDLFDALASMRPPSSKLEREQVRGRLVTALKRKFKEIGSAASAAKTTDAWLRGEAESSGLQGQEFKVEEIVPWESCVSAADVLDEAEALFSAYVHATEEQFVAITLWTAYSHVYDCFGVSPILDISSPTKRCGKSTAIIVARHLCRAPLLSGNITPAAVFRVVDAWKPTLLIDEADTFATMNDELRGNVNAGHTRATAFVVRSEADSHEPRLFSTWAPKIVAAIGRLPDTIEDRAIRVVLTRKPVGVKKRDAFDPEGVGRDTDPVGRKLARFALDEIDAIASADVARPHGLHDRAWNNWKPLFAVASVAGPEWLARAIRAALVLSGDGNDDVEEDVGTLALQHVWEVLEPAGRLKTADVLDHMVSKDEGPWAKWWEAHLTKGELKSPAASLARLLRPFGIRPRQVWIEGRNERLRR